MGEEFFRSIDSLYERFLSNLGNFLSEHGLALLTILVAAWIIRRFGSQFFAKILEKTARSDLYPTKSDRAKRLRTIENLAGDILNIAVNIVVLLMVISELGVDTTPLLASAGALGIVVGIGAQSLVRDLASGFFIIIGNQYRVGDEVQLRVGGAMAIIEGSVEDIGIRSTTIRELNGNLHHVPNGNINVATNKTIGFSRINIDFVFPASTNIDKLSATINKVGQDLADDPDFEKKIKDPPRFVRITKLDKDGMNIKVLGKVGSVNRYEVEGEFNKRLLLELKKAKIKLPINE